MNKGKAVAYLTTDQHGTTRFLPIDKPIRKQLLEYFHRQHCAKMFVDLVAGGSRHVGYIIAGHWIRVQVVCNWRD